MRKKPLLFGIVIAVIALATITFSIWYGHGEQQIKLPPGSSVRAVSYDTSLCRIHPSRQACDGKVPKAPWDAQASSGKNGNEACVDGTERVLVEQPLDRDHPGIGGIQVLWLPPCHALAALLEINRAVIEMTITLTSPQTDRSYFTSQHLAGFSEVNELASPLLYTEGHEHIVVTVQIHLLDGIFLSASVESQAPADSLRQKSKGKMEGSHYETYHERTVECP
jgi:hypothetical protein